MIGPVHCGCGPGSIMLKPLSWDTLYIYRYYNDDDALDKLNLPAAHLSRKSTGFVEHWELYSLQVNIIFRFSDFRKLSYDSHHIGFLSKFGLNYDSCRGPNNCTRTKTSCFSKRSADSRLAGWSIDRTKPNRM